MSKTGKNAPAAAAVAEQVEKKEIKSAGHNPILIPTDSIMNRLVEAKSGWLHQAGMQCLSQIEMLLPCFFGKQIISQLEIQVPWSLVGGFEVGGLEIAFDPASFSQFELAFFIQPDIVLFQVVLHLVTHKYPSYIQCLTDDSL